MSMKKKKESVSAKGELILYQTEDGKTRVEVHLQDETVWLSQKLMSELFQVTIPTINEHIKTIYADGELDAGATIRKFLIVQAEGSRQVKRPVDFYNLGQLLNAKRNEAAAGKHMQ